MCGCNQPKAPLNNMPESLLTSSGNFEPQSIIRVTDPDSKESMVLMEYVGDESKYTINSRVSRVVYQFGDNEHRRSRPVFFDDVNFLLSLNKAGVNLFRMVSSIAVPDTHDPAAFLGAPISA